MNAAQILPDCSRLRREHVKDLAEEIVEAIAGTGRTLSIFLTGNGVLGCSWLAEDDFLGMPLVGRYDESATAAEIIEDILAMEREPIGATP